MLNQDIEYLTPEGLENLENRLRYLTEERRPELAERLRHVVDEGGELAENTEYEAAKNDQGLLEGEIIRIQSILNRAEIIEKTTSNDVVTLGSRVTVIDKETKEEEVYQVVGPAEANPRAGKISFASPAGKALLGKAVGAKVSFEAPGGEVVFKIKSIA